MRTSDSKEWKGQESAFLCYIQMGKSTYETEIFICLPKTCTNDLEQLTRCLALSELLTKFNMKAFSDFFFFIQHGEICLLLKQGCDWRIVYQTLFEEITESQNIFCCKPHFKINVVQKTPVVLFFAFCGKGEESNTPWECSVSLCRGVHCKAYVVLFWGWSPTCCSCPNEPTVWDLPFFYQVDLSPPTHTHNLSLWYFSSLALYSYGPQI